MKFSFEVVKIPQLSGNRASFYTAYMSDDETSLFDQFLVKNSRDHLSELEKILDGITTMANKTGARDDFFEKYEGLKIGEGVYALYAKQLRLYCFRMDNHIVLLGGGGWKTVAKWQDDTQLATDVNRVRFIAQQIDARIRNRDIRRSPDDLNLIGDLTFDFDDDID